MEFKKSKSMKVSVLKEQENQLSSKEKIAKACQQEDVIAFDIYVGGDLVGFAMLREYEEGAYFLWNFAISSNYQNRHIGTEALKSLIHFMIEKYHMRIITTTYIWGNEHAKYVYEKVGFKETDIVDEPDCHEVNMIYYC